MTSRGVNANPRDRCTRRTELRVLGSQQGVHGVVGRVNVEDLALRTLSGLVRGWQVPMYQDAIVPTLVRGHAVLHKLGISLDEAVRDLLQLLNTDMSCCWSAWDSKATHNSYVLSGNLVELASW